MKIDLNENNIIYYVTFDSNKNILITSLEFIRNEISYDDAEGLTMEVNYIFETNRQLRTNGNDDLTECEGYIIPKSTLNECFNKVSNLTKHSYSTYCDKEFLIKLITAITNDNLNEFVKENIND